MATPCVSSHRASPTVVAEARIFTPPARTRANTSDEHSGAALQEVISILVEHGALLPSPPAPSPNLGEGVPR
jgi:hypothetical protein